MIITRQKARTAITEALGSHTRIFLIGCGLCAATCETGGEKEVREMSRFLAAAGKEILAELLVEGVCHKRRLELTARQSAERTRGADAALVLACGSGTQTAAEVFPFPVHTALDTLFLGQIRRHGEFREMCLMCGDCLLDRQAGICPVARCPKSLLNGPCGGAEGGKCEVLPEEDCIWIQIYNNFSQRGKLEELKKIIPPRDHSRTIHPGQVETRKK